MIWLIGLLVLLPIDIIELPFNVAFVDLWLLMGLPFVWLYFIRRRQRISLSYILAMWLILLGSFGSAFAAPDAPKSLIVILKEIYIFVWFITLAALLSTLGKMDFRRIMIVWFGVVLLHGFLIVGQFLVPDLWRLTLQISRAKEAYDIFRPSGLFTNANTAAFFQLLAFVPLLLANLPKRTTMILGLLLFCTMILTGSMGATLAFMTGLSVAVAVLTFKGHFTIVAKTFMQIGAVLLFFAAVLLLFISQNQTTREHFESIFLGRAEKSSGGRFYLWQRGLDVLESEEVFILGVGPENFRVYDGRDKQLHNDFMAFAVERGLLGTAGLVLFAIIALSRAVYILLATDNKYSDRSRLVVVVFLAAIIAAIVESLTHQTFHTRQLWLVLAVQEAMLLRMKNSVSGSEPATRAISRLTRNRHGYLVPTDRELPVG